MFEKVSTSMDFLAREKEVLKFWKEKEIFKKSIDLRKGNECFTFFDGPPTTNGKPHIGHIETRAISCEGIISGLLVSAQVCVDRSSLYWSLHFVV